MDEMMVARSVANILDEHGYLQDRATGVWHQPGMESIGYSDGQELEERLAREVLAVEDRSVNSPEWADHIVDWPSEYHFSRQRSNLLVPIPIKAGERVLELGAGCGAITRWLGETGAEVIAVEGSARRAAIIAARCRDLANVHVVIQNVHAIPRFSADWVTLIGVLEYSRVFHAAADPVASTLIAARDQLAPGGALVLAIENQLGLKYFAGCLEDHVNKRFAGIQGLYRADGPVTFGRRELADRLAAAGFHGQRFFLPWPDYKLPSAIVDERAARDPDFDVAGFVARCFSRDYLGPSVRSFPETLVWGVLQRNGLIPDLANSFLVVAAATETSLAVRAPDPSTLAWNYSNNRRAPLSVTTRIVKHGNALQVRKQKVGRSAETEPGRWKHEIELIADYWLGEPLSFRMLRAIQAEDESTFFEAGLAWIDLLRERSCLRDPSRPHDVASWLTDGAALDLIPGNIIVDRSGKLRWFDQEWSCTEDVPLAWIVLRGLIHFPFHTVQAPFFRNNSIIDTARDLLACRELSLAQSDVTAACESEAAFQSWVTGTPLARCRVSDAWLRTPGASLAPSAFELARSAAENQARLEPQLDRAYQLVHEAQEALPRAAAQWRRIEEEYQLCLDRHREEIHRLEQLSEERRRIIEKFECHPVLGRALKGRRLLKNAVRKFRLHAAG
jgi:SAM-dependent methyltransferase